MAVITSPCLYFCDIMPMLDVVVVESLPITLFLKKNSGNMQSSYCRWRSCKTVYFYNHNSVLNKSSHIGPRALFTVSLGLRLGFWLCLDPDRVSLETRSGSKSVNFLLSKYKPFTFTKLHSRNASESIVCKMVAILSWGKWVNAVLAIRFNTLKRLGCQNDALDHNRIVFFFDIHN